jgi:hypothetical protein
MRSNKITAGAWKRKNPTGFIRPKRISRRRQAKIQKQIAQALLAAQIREGVKSLDDGPRITEV